LDSGDTLRAWVSPTIPKPTPPTSISPTNKLVAGRESVPIDPPEVMQAMVVLDWKDGKIVGKSAVRAALLHPDLLRQAVRPGQ
jgi:hypothetical protein